MFAWMLCRACYRNMGFIKWYSSIFLNSMQNHLLIFNQNAWPAWLTLFMKWPEQHFPVYKPPFFIKWTTSISFQSRLETWNYFLSIRSLAFITCGLAGAFCQGSSVAPMFLAIEENPLQISMPTFSKTTLLPCMILFGWNFSFYLDTYIYILYQIS